MLHPGLQLPDASSAAAMEDQLTMFMSKALRPLLPRQQYSMLVEQLGVVTGGTHF
jgi:hypothetical protein